MAIKRFFNITGSTGVTVELVAPFSEGSEITSMVVANIHATASATFTLFIEDSPVAGSSERFTILSTIIIPHNSSLVLSGADIPSVPNKFGTYVTVGSSDTINVLINT